MIFRISKNVGSFCRVYVKVFILIQEEEEEEEEEEICWYTLLNPIVCHRITYVIRVISLEQTQPTTAVKEKGKGSNKPVLNTTVPLSMSFNSKLLACRRNIPSIFTTPALFVLQKAFVYIILFT
jgi:hypothetical protein